MGGRIMPSVAEVSGSLQTIRVSASPRADTSSEYVLPNDEVNETPSSGQCA